MSVWTTFNYFVHTAIKPCSYRMVRLVSLYWTGLRLTFRQKLKSGGCLWRKWLRSAAPPLESLWAGADFCRRVVFEERGFEYDVAAASLSSFRSMPLLIAYRLPLDCPLCEQMPKPAKTVWTELDLSRGWLMLSAKKNQNPAAVAVVVGFDHSRWHLVSINTIKPARSSEPRWIMALRRGGIAIDVIRKNKWRNGGVNKLARTWPHRPSTPPPCTACCREGGRKFELNPLLKIMLSTHIVQGHDVLCNDQLTLNKKLPCWENRWKPYFNVLSWIFNIQKSDYTGLPLIIWRTSIKQSSAHFNFLLCKITEIGNNVPLALLVLYSLTSNNFPLS